CMVLAVIPVSFSAAWCLGCDGPPQRYEQAQRRSGRQGGPRREIGAQHQQAFVHRLEQAQQIIADRDDRQVLDRFLDFDLGVGAFDAVLRVFWRKGYEGASYTGLTEVAGLKKAPEGSLLAGVAKSVHGRPQYTPCASIASATLTKPA